MTDTALRRTAWLGQRTKEAVLSGLTRSGLCEAYTRALRLVQPDAAVILTYHRVGGCDVLTRSSDQFRRDIAWLHRRFECTTLRDLCDRWERKLPARRPVAVVTFDDGYASNASIAAPILLAQGVPATFFVATGFVGSDREFPHDVAAGAGPFAKMTWDDLLALEDAGFEVGAHTVNHCDLGATDAAAVRRELGQARDALHRHLGERPRAMAYPWGAPRNVPANATALLSEAGYYAAVTTQAGFATRSTPRMLLPRIDVGNGAISAAGFQARVLRCPLVGRVRRHY